MNNLTVADLGLLATEIRIAATGLGWRLEVVCTDGGTAVAADVVTRMVVAPHPRECVGPASRV